MMFMQSKSYITAQHPCLRAFIFDVDGTLADTEEAHRQAFNAAFRALGFDENTWHWNVALYKTLLKVSGGKERIRAYAASLATKNLRLDKDAIDDHHLLYIASATGMQILDQAMLSQIHQLKTDFYLQALQSGKIKLRCGVKSLIMEAAQAGLSLAIATTTSTQNVTALLTQHFGAHWRELFGVVEDATTAKQKKPNAQVYHQALARLQIQANAALAFEDSRNGMLAARAAGIACIVTPCQYTDTDDVSKADWVLPNLEGLTLSQLRTWHREHLERKQYASCF